MWEKNINSIPTYCCAFWHSEFRYDISSKGCFACLHLAEQRRTYSCNTVFISLVGIYLQAKMRKSDDLFSVKKTLGYKIIISRFGVTHFSANSYHTFSACCYQKTKQTFTLLFTCLFCNTCGSNPAGLLDNNFSLFHQQTDRVVIVTLSIQYTTYNKT